MRVITLVLIIVVIFFFAKDAHGRTIMLDEEQVETVEGKTFYVLTMCKDSYQYTGYHTGDLLDFKIIQDFEQTATSNQPIPCMMDFKDQSQLEKWYDTWKINYHSSVMHFMVINCVFNTRNNTK